MPEGNCRKKFVSPEGAAGVPGRAAAAAGIFRLRSEWRGVT